MGEVTVGQGVGPTHFTQNKNDETYRQKGDITYLREQKKK